MQDLDEKDLKDHEADRIAWDKHFGHGRGEAIMWPFQSIDATPDDIADAISPTYQTWRLSRGLPICDSPKTFGDRKATVLSLSQLQMLWDEFSPYSSLKGQPPVTGPYQIALPAWIDTDNLFFGRGRLLDTINSEIILLHLAVSWNKEDESYLTTYESYLTVVVGFNPTSCVVPDEHAERSLRYLWQVVADWVMDTYYGGIMTLETYLRVCKAVPLPDNDFYAYGGMEGLAASMFDHVQTDIPDSIERARANREFIT
ncbi:hypothetical protein FOFC_14259 [Fusarium oxysporum]|nr:hypothetical protein FOFC_14259 [Fusarium oxysporum]